MIDKNMTSRKLLRPIIIVGAPYSGINLLKECLKVVGIGNINSPEYDRIRNDLSCAQAEIFQELNIYPHMVGSLPTGWIQTRAAKKAKTLIKELLEFTNHEHEYCVLGDSITSRVVPLYLEVCDELNVEPAFVHIIRHPWEVAQALNVNVDIDLDSGHRIWLSYYKNVNNLIASFLKVRITYERYLNDPLLLLLLIKEELQLDFLIDLKKDYPIELMRTLEMISDSRNGTSISQRDKNLYGVFLRLYDQKAKEELDNLTKRNLFDAKTNAFLNPFIFRSEKTVLANHKILEINNTLECLKKYIDEPDQKSEQCVISFLKEQEFSKPVSNFVLEKICEGNQLILSDSIIEFHDRKALWTCIQEILINEEYFFNTSSSNPKIIDCGSNFGLSLYYFKKIYKNANIVAFEPDPSIRKILQNNLRRNNWDNVEILPYAISDSEDKSNFIISENDSLAGSLTERRREKGNKVHEIQVECHRLHHYLKSPTDLLKIDIEGSEDKVLVDAAPFLGNVLYLFCEYHHGLGLSSDRLKIILDVLDNAGFEYHVNKSLVFSNISSFRPMNYVSKAYSALIFARNKNWQQGQINAKEAYENH